MEILILHFLPNYQTANADTTLSLENYTAIIIYDLSRCPKLRVKYVAENLLNKPILMTNGGLLGLCCLNLPLPLVCYGFYYKTYKLGLLLSND